MDMGNVITLERGHSSVCLYVFSPSKQERRYQLQWEKLSDRSHMLSEHEVTIAEVFEQEQGHIGEEEISSNNSEALRQQFHVNPGQFKVVLVSDSGVKLSADSCVSCEEVIMRVENEPIEPRHSFI